MLGEAERMCMFRIRDLSPIDKQFRFKYFLWFEMQTAQCEYC